MKAPIEIKLNECAILRVHPENIIATVRTNKTIEIFLHGINEPFVIHDADTIQKYNQRAVDEIW